MRENKVCEANVRGVRKGLVLSFDRCGVDIVEVEGTLIADSVSG